LNEIAVLSARLFRLGKRLQEARRRRDFLDLTSV
jgi:hypothetical protein